MNIGILEPKNFSQKAINQLKKIGNVLIYNKINEIKDFIYNIEILFIRLDYKIDQEFIKYTPKLKYICSPTTGLNHIDANVIKKNNIKVISLKGETEFLADIRATPEHTFGLVLSLLRNYKNGFLNTKNNDWNRELYFGNEIFNNNIGIIGLGRIGKILIRYFKCFGANIYFYDIDKNIDYKDGIKIKSIEELIHKSDIILLTASFNGKKIITQKELLLMKNKYFINTARGELVDENALIKLIEKAYFKGVAIDVLENETEIENNNLQKFIKLTENHNLIITPHLGGATYTSLNRTEEFIVKKLKKELNN